MKLQRLHIENYGIFADQELDFGGHPLQVIYGPNATGKSTLLQLIRDVLFGFPHRMDYAFGERTGEVAATVWFELQDGREGYYRRRKGRNAPVVGQLVDHAHQAAESFDEEDWQQLLTHGGAELYSQVFAISLSELTAAEDSLPKAGLREALFGIGLGDWPM
ncbi:MAG: AAA family ATPase [Pirellulaceae bacterium]